MKRNLHVTHEKIHIFITFYIIRVRRIETRPRLSIVYYRVGLDTPPPSQSKTRMGQDTGDQTGEVEHYLVVMGTSARPLSSTAGAKRTKATTGRSRNSSSPTRTLEASAPGGIFFMKWRSICVTRQRERKTNTSGTR